MIYNDLEILEQIRKGDEKAYEMLFRDFYKSLCHFSYKIVNDAVVAEEIVQDIFFYIWDKRISLELSISLKSYLFKSVQNNSLKYLRHQKVVSNHASIVKDSLEKAYELQENYTEIGEITYIIQKTLNEIPERTREIFQLNRYDGLKYHEIAIQLNISVKTVEAHITWLLKLFRENLKDYLVIIAAIPFFELLIG